MHIFFRTDGNKIIATGHVMRCLSIADAFHEIGHEVTFITADNQCSDLICQRGYGFISLSGKWDDLEYELGALKHLISMYDIQMLVIDSYYVTEKYLMTLKSMIQTVYIDDLNAFHYPIDILVSYSIYTDKFLYSSRYPNTKLLLGCDYAPLRLQFRNIGKKIIRKQVKNILITTGGADKHNMACSLVNRMLCDTVFEHISIHVIIGKFNSNMATLQVLEEQNDNVIVYCNVENMAAVMIKADIAISAGGSTLYELSACGVPTVTYAFADNQLNNVLGFAERGLMEYAGDIRKDQKACVESMMIALKTYVYNEEKRIKASQELQRLVDGMGSERIVNYIAQEHKKRNNEWRTDGSI